MSPWIFLSIAIALEVSGTFFLKLSDGFAKWQWGVLAIICYSLCFWVLAPALKALPVGIVYAIWAGVGIAAAVLLSLLVFDEKIQTIQFAFIALILIGAVGLQMTTNHT